MSFSDDVRRHDPKLSVSTDRRGRTVVERRLGDGRQIRVLTTDAPSDRALEDLRRRDIRRCGRDAIEREYAQAIDREHEARDKALSEVAGAYARDYLAPAFLHAKRKSGLTFHRTGTRSPYGGYIIIKGTR